jgi:hypothetical protein
LPAVEFSKRMIQKRCADQHGARKIMSAKLRMM